MTTPPKTYPSIQGRCPACRGDSLFIGSGGYVTCSRLDCPNPTAADQLLHGEQPAPAEDAIARVRALHYQDGDHCAVCTEDFGRLSAPWPCPTIRALDAEQPAPAPAATQATDDARAGQRLTAHQAATAADLPPGSIIRATPREHCGDLMPAWVAGPRTECVLPPDHAGSHADDRGARWRYDPLSTGHS